MSQGFTEVRLDPRISREARVSIRRSTQVVELENAAEERVSKWKNSRRVMDIGYAASEPGRIQQIQEFFEARMGRAFGFRVKDWMDYHTGAHNAEPTPQDQFLGLGDGVTRTAQLVKRYGSGFDVYTRPIVKPRPGLEIAIDGQVTGECEVDFSTGVVTFGAAPAVGATLTWGGEFDVPMRFASDELSAEMLGQDIARIPQIELIEDPNFLSDPREQGFLFLNLVNPLAELVNVDLPALFGVQP